MARVNEKTNWKALIFIVVCSATLGIIIDFLVNLDNRTFYISGYLPKLMVVLYFDYLLVDLNKIEIVKSTIDKVERWRHTLFSFIVFLVIVSVVFAVIALIFGMRLNELDLKDSRPYLVISFTVIFVLTYGDNVLLWLFKTFDLSRALEGQVYFFNQDMTKMLIYFSYLVLIFVTNCGIKSDSSQLWINTFATFVAFERLQKHWKEQKKKAEELKLN